MTIFLQKGNCFTVTTKEALQATEQLPNGVYTVGLNIQGYFLEKTQDFEFAGRRYGENIEYTNRIISTFLDRTSSTGILLSGNKGSGKTLLAKMISIELSKLNIPTIIVNSPFHDDGFLNLVKEIEQPCLFIFDEFEKVYDREEEQNPILSLLDGLYSTKKLFILTVNTVWKVSEYLLNRPGRLFYHIKFRRLSDAFIREYCEDNLLNKENIEQIVTVAANINNFNFDMLQAMVQDMNRYTESASSALRYLNIDVDNSHAQFKFVSFRDDKGNEKKATYPNQTYSLNLGGTSHSFTVYVEKPLWEYDNNGDEIVGKPQINPLTKEPRTTSEYIEFETGDISKFTPKDKIFSFQNEEGNVVVMRKVEKEDVSFFQHLAF